MIEEIALGLGIVILGFIVYVVKDLSTTHIAKH